MPHPACGRRPPPRLTLAREHPRRLVGRTVVADREGAGLVLGGIGWRGEEGADEPAGAAAAVEGAGEGLAVGPCRRLRRAGIGAPVEGAAEGAVAIGEVPG